MKTPKTTNSTQSRVADSRVEAAQALKPAALIYQSLIRDDPLAYCLLVAKRMRFWQAVCLKRMDYAQEKICRNEAENWEAQARRLRAMGHAVKWQRARELELPVDGKTVLPVGVEDLALPAAQTAATDRPDAATQSPRRPAVAR